MIAARYKERPEQPVTLYGATKTTVRWLINRDNGARTFAMRRFEIKPGGEIPLHAHAEDHEMYILAGRGVAFTETQKVPVNPDMFVYVPPQEPHGYRNTGRTPLIMLCMIPLVS